MIKKISLILVWLVFSFADYFYLPYFIQPFSWFLVCLILLILSIRQVVRIINERKNLDTNRIIDLLVPLLLLFLTFFNFHQIAIEKIDWSVSYNRRNKIVADVLNKKLTPNTEMNNGICRLPFDFPVISNGGNDIWIYENKIEGTKTIKFWISRGFFESPQTYFIFTNDRETKKQYSELIKTKPEYNWKLEENWFRIMERD